MKNNPKLFFILSLGSLIPDLDLLFGGHRYASHSILLPLIFLLIPLFYKSDRYPNLSFNLQFLGLIWISHMIFDLTFGPMALFWPIDDRFYDAIMGVRFNLEGNSILPITIAGLFFQLVASDPNTGTTVYFVNWSIEQRIAYFGSSEIKWPIENFNTQAVIFLWYLYFVVVPFITSMMHNILSYEENDKRISAVIISMASLINRIKSSTNRLYKIYRKRDDWMRVVVLILLIYFSLFAGPLQGKQWQEVQNSKESFWTLTEGSRIIGMKSFSLPDNSDIMLNVNIDQSTLAFDIFVIEITEDKGNNIIANVSRLRDSLDVNNITQGEFFNNYMFYIHNVVDQYSSVDENNSAQWNFQSNKKISLLMGLYTWNINQSFIKSVSIQSIWNISRENQYNNGIVSAIVFSIVLVSILIRDNKKLNK